MADATIVDVNSLEFIIAATGTGVGLMLGASCTTNKLMRLSRRLTFSIGLASVSFIVHGMHHFIVGDELMGPISDVMLSLGVLGVIVELYIMQYKKDHPAGAA